MQELISSDDLFNEYSPVILNCSLFKNIKSLELRDLLKCLSASFKNFEADEYIFHLGDDISHIYIVLDGTVEIIKETLNGNRNIVTFLEPSHLFGEGVVCTTKHLAPVSAQATSKVTLLTIPYERILLSCGHNCHFHHQLIHNMMLLLGEKNYILNQKIDILVLKGMREKLITYLLNEAHYQNAQSFNIPLNRNELADYLNVSRPSMCRELKKLKDEKLIDYYKNTFKIIDVEKLKAFCN